jgi:hypothetical protein
MQGAHNETVRDGKSDDLGVIAKSKQRHTANPLFWNILQLSRLSAIFCRDPRISEAGKYRRINNLAAVTKKIIFDV